MVTVHCQSSTFSLSMQTHSNTRSTSGAFSLLYLLYLYAWKSSGHIQYCPSLEEHNNACFHRSHMPINSREIKSVLFNCPREQVLAVDSNGCDPFNHDQQALRLSATAVVWNTTEETMFHEVQWLCHWLKAWFTMLLHRYPTRNTSWSIT